MCCLADSNDHDSRDSTKLNGLGRQNDPGMIELDLAFHDGGNVDGRESLAKNFADDLFCRWHGFHQQTVQAFRTLGFNMLRGRCPWKSATIFVAAIRAIFERVSIEEDARCGAKTTFGRFSPG